MTATLRTALLAACLAAAGCATTLPEYAAPKGRPIDFDEYDASDVISYRTLAREDFKGVQAPPAFAPYADSIGAATCAYILTTPETHVAIQGERRANGDVVYRARAEQLGFRTQMDRRCSWWNTAQTALPPEYVLEHEQIHFALFELEVRKLNRESAAIQSRLQGSADTPEAAVARVRQMLQEEIGQRMGSILARSRDFDEDTSMGFRPARQKAWLADVERELAAGAP